MGVGAGKPDQLLLLREECKSREEGIALAAWQLEDAIENRLVDDYPKHRLARQTHFEVAKASFDYTRALQLLVILTIFETPSWCDTHHNIFSFVNSTDRCPVLPNAGDGERRDGYIPNDGKHLLLSDVPYIPPGWGCVLEVILYTVIARKFLLELKLQNWFFDEITDETTNDKKSIEYIDRGMTRFGLAMVIFGFLDCGVYFFITRSMDSVSFRMTFLVRTGILSTLPAVKNLMKCVLAVIQEFLSILCFLVATIVFFAWIAVTIFDDITGYSLTTLPGKEKQMINKGLDTFMNTLDTMFIAGATDEFVGCFLNSYTSIRASGLLWLVFLIIVQVLLLNLVLDTLVAAYRRHTDDLVKVEVKKQADGIRDAFRTLHKATSEVDATSGFCTISKESFMEFIEDFSSSPYMRPITRETADLMFKGIDEDGSGTISSGEFCHLCAVLNYEFWITKVDSPVAEVFPTIWNSGPFKFIRDMCETEEYVLVRHMAPSEGGKKEVVPESYWTESGATARFEELEDEKDATALFGPEGDEPLQSNPAYRESEEVIQHWYEKYQEKRRKQGDDVSSYFDYVMTVVLGFNLALVLAETWYDRNGIPETKFMEQMELVFSFVYVMECGVKLCVFSWAEYCSDRSNVFDFFTTWLLLFSSLLSYWIDSPGGPSAVQQPDAAPPSFLFLPALARFSPRREQQGGAFNLKRYVNILRLLRLLRVIKQLKRFQKVQLMVQTVTVLVMRSKEILTALLIMVFFFTTLSVQLWGGLLYKGNVLLEGTEYDEKEYYVLNFNDFLSAFGVWIVSLLCEYVPEFPDAIGRTTQGFFGGLSGRIVCIVFYFFGVSVIFELVKAFTIEVFLGLRKKWDKEKEEVFNGLDSCKAECRKDHERLHYRAIGDDEVIEMLIKKLKEMEEDMEKEETTMHGTSDRASIVVLPTGEHGETSEAVGGALISIHGHKAHGQ